MDTSRTGHGRGVALARRAQPEVEEVEQEVGGGGKAWPEVSQEQALELVERAWVFG